MKTMNREGLGLLKRLIWLRIIGRDLSAVCTIATISMCCGFALNQFQGTPLPLVYCSKAERIQQAMAKLAPVTKADLLTQPPSTAAEVHYMELPEFREVVENKAKWIILDARPEVFYQMGHVPGAISLPQDEFETSYSKQRGLLEIDKSRRIVVYCSDRDCKDSQMVADALAKLAYTSIRVFKGGWNDWTKAHLPEEKPR